MFFLGGHSFEVKMEIPNYNSLSVCEGVGLHILKKKWRSSEERKTPLDKWRYILRLP